MPSFLPAGKQAPLMAREKGLGNIGGKKSSSGGRKPFKAKLRTDRFEQRFTLDDIAECRVAGPRQYGFIQFALRGEAATG